MQEGAYDTMTELVRMLKALADPTRVRIVRLLEGRDDLCVCEIVDALEIPQYSVSRHLGVLKAAGIVTDWRQGKWMHYALNPALPAEERAVVAAVCARVGREPVARQDRRRLQEHLRPRVKGGAIACK
jgi:ArsR family transcriptional regulator